MSIIARVLSMSARGGTQYLPEISSEEITAPEFFVRGRGEDCFDDRPRCRGTSRMVFSNPVRHLKQAGSEPQGSKSRSGSNLFPF